MWEFIPVCYVTRAEDGREQRETKQYAEDQRAGSGDPEMEFRFPVPQSKGCSQLSSNIRPCGASSKCYGIIYIENIQTKPNPNHTQNEKEKQTPNKKPETLTLKKIKNLN